MIEDSYFLRVKKQTPTRLWINNPTTQEADKAIAAGAISCTTNPTYCMKQINAGIDTSLIMKIIRNITNNINGKNG